MVDSVYSGQTESQPTDAIFILLTRAWGDEGCDEVGWEKAELHREAGACVLRGMSHCQP